MQRLRGPAAENAGRQSPIGESWCGLPHLNKFSSRKARLFKNEQSKFLKRCERSSLNK